VSRRQEKRLQRQRRLERQLAGGEAGARAGAARELGGMGGRIAVKPLLAALDDPHPSVRQAVIASLARTRHPEAVAPLRAALDDVEPEVGAAAADALAALGALDVLLAAAARGAVEGRRQALRGLALIGDSTAMGVAVDALRVIGLEEAAVAALVALGDPRALPPLVRALEDGVRGAALGVGRLGDGRNLTSLLMAIGRDGIRLEAMAGLGLLRDRRAAGACQQLLLDAEPAMRVAAARTLSRLGEPHWEALILGDEGDQERLQRSGAPGLGALLWEAARSAPEGSERQLALIRALGGVGGSAESALLVALLGSRSPVTRVATAEALAGLRSERWATLVRGDGGDLARLGDCGDPRAVRALVYALEQGWQDPERQRAAARALGGASGLAASAEQRRQAIASLRLRVGDGARAAAWVARVHLGEPEALEEAIQQLEQRGGAGRARAAAALGGSRHAQARGPLLRALGDTEPAVRRAAAEGLRAHGWRRWVEWVRGDAGDWARIRDSGHHEAVTPLLHALSEGVPGMTAALGQLADPRSVMALLERVDGPDGAAAAAALGGIQGIEAERALRLTLASDNRAARLAAARALDARAPEAAWCRYIRGDGGDLSRLAEALPDASPTLLRAMSSDLAANRAAAARALTGVAAQPLIRSALRDALADAEPTVQAAAAAALVTAGVMDPVPVLEANERVEALACLLSDPADEPGAVGRVSLKPEEDA